MSLCGLRRPPPLRPRREAKKDKEKGREKSVPGDEYHDPGLLDVRREPNDSERNSLLHRASANFDWAREDQLSTILEFEDSGSRRDESQDYHVPVTPTPEQPPRKARVIKPRVKRTRFVEHLSSPGNISKLYRERMSSSMSDRRTPDTPRPIAPPPRDVSWLIVLCDMWREKTNEVPQSSSR